MFKKIKKQQQFGRFCICQNASDFGGCRMLMSHEGEECGNLGKL